jgi:hypothetical protein
MNNFCVLVNQFAAQNRRIACVSESVLLLQIFEDNILTFGVHNYMFSSNGIGNNLTSGLYICRISEVGLKTKNIFTASKKLLLLK